jgi:serine/threonine protein kinase
MAKDLVPEKIGEGGYGCIHSPNLTCSNNKQYSTSSPDKISKILKTKYADIERSEYINMHRADPKRKFYLGDPHQCNVSITKSNLIAISKCDDAPDIVKNIDEYSLLLMEYGGLNLREYGDNIAKWPNTTANKKKIERFWLESHRLLRGVKMLLNNGLIHSDFKPHNIVYDEKKKRLNFIDFGLMKTLSATKLKIATDEYKNTKCHFSHPFEVVFLSKRNFHEFAKKTIAEKEKYCRDWIQDVEDISSECGKKIDDFFYYIFTDSREDLDAKRIILNDYVEMIRSLPENFEKWDYMKTLDTFDIYGIGFTYLYMLKSCKHLLDTSIYYDFRNLFLRMISGDVRKRIKIDECLQEYEYIVLRNGLLDKFHVHFEKHEYFHGAPTKVGRRITRRITRKIKK